MLRLCAIVCLSLLAWLLEAAAGPIDLGAPGGHRPYRCEPGLIPVGPLVNASLSVGTCLFDLNDDGVHEAGLREIPYFQTLTLHDGMYQPGIQFNRPGRFTTPGAESWVNGAWQLDDDPAKELVVGARTAEGDEIRIWILDAETMTVQTEFPLPVGEDVSNDGLWDGAYVAMGVLDMPEGTGTRRALIFICAVNYDEFGRAVFAVDPADGTVLWWVPMANNLYPRTTYLHDVDGDGIQEILLLGFAPDNLDAADGDQVGGLRDDILRVYCLDARGALSWRRDLAEHLNNMPMALADLDGDGREELAVGASCQRTPGSIIVLEPRDGTERARYPLAVSITSLVAVPQGDDGPVPLVYGRRDGELHALGFDGDTFTDELLGRTTRPIKVGPALDLLPEPGSEYLVSVSPENLLVMSAGHEVLAQVSENSPDSFWAQGARMGDGRAQILIPRLGARGISQTLTPDPRPVPWITILGLAVMPLGYVALRRAWPRSSAPPVDLRHRRLLLLERLEQMDHNRIGALHVVRKLSVKLVLAAGASGNPEVARRVEDFADKLREKTLPRLRALADLAAAAQVAEHRTARARAALVALTQLSVDNTIPLVLAGSRVAAEKYRSVAAEAEGAFDMIRQDTIGFFRVSVSGVVDDVRTGLEDEVRAAAAELHVDGPAGLGVRCDAEEFEFVVENLVVNALRAMAGMPRRSVALVWRRDGDDVHLEVTDTGCGIAPDDWSRLLETRASDREGGGLGLPRSRRLLRRYDGELAIVASAPGEGTTFRITMPAAGD